MGRTGFVAQSEKVVLGAAVSSVPTGLSAYQLLIDVAKIGEVACPKDIFDSEEPVTTMIVGHDKRVIMGPGRGKKLLGLVALVLDGEAE